MIALDRLATVLVWNPAAEKLFGWSCKEVLGKPYPLVPDAERQDFLDLINDEFNGIRHSSKDIRRRHKNGTLIDITLSTTPMFDADGKMYAVLGILADNTARRKSERRNRLQSAALNASANAVMITDKDGIVEWVNPAFTDLTGYLPDEVIGKNPRQLVKSGKHDQAFYKNLWNTILSGNIWRGETVNRRKDGSIYTEDQTISPVRDEHDEITHFISIKEDITERKIKDEKIKRLDRVRKVLSGINKLLVRVNKRRELFKEACRIAVEKGRFQMAWIGELTGEDNKMILRALTGQDDGFIQYMLPDPDVNDPESNNPCAQAILRKKAVIYNTIPDTGETTWQTEALACGFRSFVILPLIVAQQVKGVIALYASVPEFFDNEEMNLLNELAGDISFSLHHLAQREKVNYLSSFDPLTGLANRTLFIDHLNSVLGRAKTNNRKVALFACDLRHFRNINNVFGPSTGDLVLQETAKRLLGLTADPVNIGRISGDCFVMILHDVHDASGIPPMLEKLFFPGLNKLFYINDNQLQITFSGGIAVYPMDGMDADTLYSNAEAALKKAKAENAQYLFYQHEMMAELAERLTFESSLRHALDNNEFVLHYQPKLDTAAQNITGLEALIRWNAPDSGLIPPDRFIPILEETGMILDVGKWAIEKALQDLKEWRSSGLDISHVAVNVSPVQMQQKGFLDDIADITGCYGGKNCGLELEVTEGLLMHDIDTNAGILASIRELGVDVTIDDFGTGYSSLSYLVKLPVNSLKIDRSFISSMDEKPECMNIVSSIINLAHTLNLKVIAEGVETEDQSRLLRLLKCDEMQGYLFSKPVPAEDIPGVYQKYH